MKSVEASIKEKKEFRDYVLNYHKTKYVIDELKACKNEKARQKYRDEHDSDFTILNAAKRYFDSKGLKKLPSYKVLQTEVEQLIKEKNELYKERCKSLKTVWLNWTSCSSVFMRTWSTENFPKLVSRCCPMIMSRNRKN